MLSNTRFSIKTLSLLGVLLAHPVLAADPAPQEQTPRGWSWSAHLGTLNIDSKIAEKQGIDDSAWALGFAAEHYLGNGFLTIVLGADFIAYDDNYSFHQETNKGNKGSDASAAVLYVELGPRVAFGKDDSNHFIAHVGASKILSSERGIGYCTDCYSEDIDVNGGLYGVLGVGHSFDRFDLGLQFQQYFSGDVDNSLRLRISSSF